MHRTQIALCYGTRPQVIKASVRQSCPEAPLQPRTRAALHAAGIEPGLGSCQREAYWMGTPCVTLRRAGPNIVPALEPLVS
jgi:hypothetical protein